MAATWSPSVIQHELKLVATQEPQALFEMPQQAHRPDV